MIKQLLAVIIALTVQVAQADPEDAALQATGTIKAAGCAKQVPTRGFTHYKGCGVVLATDAGDKAFQIEDQELSEELGRTAAVIKYDDGVYHVLLGEKK